MSHYKNNFITQTLIRADFVRGTFPLVTAPGEALTVLLEDYPVRSAMNRTKNEIRIEKTPQGPVKDTRSIQFVEHNFWTEDKNRRFVICSECVFLETHQYDGYRDMRDEFLAMIDAISSQYPQLRVSRLGMRYINEIKLPQADAGPGLGPDFWKNYLNELLLGGLRFAANDGALSRQMNTTELNYGADRATIKYGVFNADYPKPNRRREFILDIDTFCQEQMEPMQLGQKLNDFHNAACSVFETASTDTLRDRMGRS